MQINITEEVEDRSEAIELLQEIIRQLKLGNTSGVYPTWELIKSNQ
jgi:hypothetical protein